MQPAWHALSIFVPGYGSWQVFRHFMLIGAALARVGSKVRVDPFSAAIGALVWWVTFLHYSNEPIFVVLNAVELLAATAVVVYGQRALNEYWRARPGPPVEERIRETDWLAVGVAAIYFVGTLFSYLTTPTN